MPPEQLGGFGTSILPDSAVESKLLTPCFRCIRQMSVQRSARTQQNTKRFHTNYRILQDDIPCFFYLNFFFHDLFSYFFKIIPPEDLGQNKSDYTSCNVAALLL